MDRGLKVLVAVTCLAALAALAWWGWSEWGDAQARGLDAERSAEETDRERRWAEVARRERCEADVAAWDAGQRQALQAELGDAAEAVVDSCRLILRIAQD